MSIATMQEIESNSFEDTERLGERLGQKLRGGELIELVGDLGSGKTTFVRGIARGAGSHDVVSSPSFTIEKQYTCPTFIIRHFDLYRLAQDQVMLQLTIQEAITSGDVVIVEWASQLQTPISQRHLTIEITSSNNYENARRFSYKIPDKMKYLIDA